MRLKLYSRITYSGGKSFKQWKTIPSVQVGPGQHKSWKFCPVPSKIPPSICPASKQTLLKAHNNIKQSINIIGGSWEILKCYYLLQLLMSGLSQCLVMEGQYVILFIIYYLSNTLLSSNESIFVETVPVVLERFDILWCFNFFFHHFSQLQAKLFPGKHVNIHLPGKVFILMGDPPWQ